MIEFDLEKEIQKYLESIGVGSGSYIDGMEDEDLRKIARYFYDLGFREGEGCGANSIVPAE